MRARLTRRGLAVTAAATAIMLGTSGVAVAEGYFSSYLSGVLAGKESRSWSDRNNDGTWTTVRLTTCRVRGESTATVVLRLYRERAAQTDVLVGARTFNCRQASTQNWGDVAAGTYHFTVHRVNGSVSKVLDVDKVEVWY